MTLFDELFGNSVDVSNSIILYKMTSIQNFENFFCENELYRTNISNRLHLPFNENVNIKVFHIFVSSIVICVASLVYSI